MLLFATIIGVVVVVFAALAAIFQLLDIVWDRRDKERIKARILDFWIKTSDLALIDQVNSALEARYARTRSLRPKFIVLFWTFCGIAIAFAAIELLGQDAGELRKSFTETLKVNLDTDFRIRCSSLHGSEDEGQERCDPDKESNDSSEILRFRATRTKFLAFTTGLSDNSLRMSAIISEIISAVIVAIPATFALYLSLKLTLWLLSRITRSGMKFLLLVVLDIFVAISMPPFLTSLMIVTVVALEVLVSGQILSIASFSEANWMTLTFGSALLQVNISFIWVALGFLVLTLLPSKLVAMFTVLAILNVPIALAAFRIQSFMEDVLKVLKFDFSTDLIQAVIDWAIFTDLLFSAFFLGPSLLLVIANRNGALRKAFLNLVMWIGDHAKGPFVAGAELASIILAMFKPRKS